MPGLIAVVFDKNGELIMVVQPDSDAQLDDPSFNPPDCVQIRMDREEYQLLPTALNFDGLANYHDLAKAVVDEIEVKSPAIADKVQEKIDVTQAEIDKPIPEEP